MDGNGIISILQNFGSFGLALGVVGSIGWTIWKKVIEPQQEEIRKEHKAHIETLQRLAENSGNITQEFINLSRENITTMKELNGKISTHHVQMQEEHKRNLDAISRNQR